MRIDVVCSDPDHPVLPLLRDWCRQHGAKLGSRLDTLEGGDFLFLVSCQSLVKPDLRARYRYCLILHASELPKGRGMSPHIWQVLEGSNHITVTLLNAADPVDTGDIWHQDQFLLQGHELHDEINAALFTCELNLMDWALQNCDSHCPRQQCGEASYYRRRIPQDSRLDPALPLQSQFNLLRVADPVRYPAFFELNGQRYEIAIKKSEGKS